MELAINSDVSYDLPTPSHTCLTPNKGKSKFWGPTATPLRRPAWVPPTLDRLASIDLGPLRSFTSSSFSPTVLSDRSSVALSSTRSRTSEALESDRSQARVEPEPQKLQQHEQLATLEEALQETEMHQRMLKARIAGLQGDMGNVRISDGRLSPTNVGHRAESSTSWTSVDQSLLDLDHWPIAQNARKQ